MMTTTDVKYPTTVRPTTAGCRGQQAVSTNGLLETVLDAGQYDVVFVESTEHAQPYQAIDAAPDYCVPRYRRLDRFQVLSMLKLDAETKDIPLVTCTSSQDDEDTPDELLDPQEGVFSQPAAMQLN
jgi:CheY-like chemotaxis protein